MKHGINTEKEAEPRTSFFRVRPCFVRGQITGQGQSTCIVYAAKSCSPHQARPDQNGIWRRTRPLRQMGLGTI